MFSLNAFTPRVAVLVTLLLAQLPCLLAAPSRTVTSVTPSASIVGPKVTLGNTWVIGKKYKFAGLVDEEFYGGIPYAEPPVGDLRFAPPVPKNSLDSWMFDATQWGPACPQLGIANYSEDCLKLNIFRPSIAKVSAPLPVVVWIFGGGFRTGSSDKFNASVLIAQSVSRATPMIYVNLNYRVGPFGFPQGAEAADKSSTNLGLKDQLAALQWVKNNIKAFGGDPNKITVMGSSAGAISIADLYLNSNLESLGITASGGSGTIPMYDATRRESEWTNFVAATPECSGASSGSTFDCMRSASIETLMASYQTTVDQSPEAFQFVPVIDGPDGIIPDLPSKLIAQGKFSKIPIMAGTNLDDGTFFTPKGISTEAQIRAFLIGATLPFQQGPPPEDFTAALDTLLEVYPEDPTIGSPYGTGAETFGLSPQYKRLASIIGDAQFQALRRSWVQEAAKAGVPVHAFLFADPAAVTEPEMGVTHGKNVPYMYGAPYTTDAHSPAGQLSLHMMDYIIAFVTSTNPNDGLGYSRPQWPKYTLDDRRILQLASANTTAIPDDYRLEQIAYLNSVQTFFAQ
ncbi:esterase 1 [Earliella scabrosa]|nr:esterase 1 [Earliella scabrosa]